MTLSSTHWEYQYSIGPLNRNTYTEILTKKWYFLMENIIISDCFIEIHREHVWKTAKSPVNFKQNWNIEVLVL